MRKRAEFLAVAAARRKWTMPGLALQARRRESEGLGLRLGFTASRHVGKAVERNRAKRRLREVARAILAEQARLDFDLVLIARPETIRRDFAALKADLRQSLVKLDILEQAS